jgi:beta-glucanase (GH16 family)
MIRLESSKKIGGSVTAGCSGVTVVPGSQRPSVPWTASLSLALALALVIGSSVPTSVLAQPDRKLRAQSSEWQLVFSDEFNGRELNRQKWQTRFPWGRDRSSVGELQYYARDAFREANGELRIVAEENPESDSHPYNSGLISSHSSFTTTYGRFEIRCKVPAGKGLWPAFWLLPVDTSWPPEIDVFELLGHETNTVHMNVHWSVDGAHRQDKGEFTGPDFSKRYHTFAVEWEPDKLTWFVDDVIRHQVTGHSPQVPMYVLANLAVGGDWPGAPNADTGFPATFKIDYIRVYEAGAALRSSSVVDDNGKKPKMDKKGKGNNDRDGAKSKRRRVSRLSSRWSR